MRVPPYYRLHEVRRLFAGMAIGAILSWLIFLYIYGEWQEEYSVQIRQQEETIRDLEQEKKIWQEDVEKINKENEDKLTIQSIEVKITNYEKYELDELSVYEIEEAVKEDIQTLLKKDIETAFKSRELTRRAIENRSFKVHDKRYRLKIKEIAYYTTLSIQLNLEFE
ncbi:sporulation membrane protein YtrI [Robertmurraya sp. Marseille-Q9965]